MSVGVPVTKSFNKLKKYPYEINKFDRRETNEYFYLPVDCPRMKKCDDAYCPLAHTKLEKIFHPIVYKTQACQMAKDGACDYFQKCAFYHDSNDKNEAHLNWTIWEKKWDKWRNNIDSILTQHNKNDKEIRRKVESILKIRMPHFNYNSNKSGLFLNKNVSFHSTWSSSGGKMGGGIGSLSGGIGSLSGGIGSSVGGGLNNLLCGSINASITHCPTTIFSNPWSAKPLSGGKKCVKSGNENKSGNNGGNNSGHNSGGGSIWANELSDLGTLSYDKTANMNTSFMNKNNVYYDETLSYNSNTTECGLNFDMLDNNAYKVVEFCFTDYENNRTKGGWRDGSDVVSVQATNSFFSHGAKAQEGDPKGSSNVGAAGVVSGAANGAASSAPSGTPSGGIAGEGSYAVQDGTPFQELTYNKACEYFPGVAEMASGEDAANQPDGMNANLCKKDHSHVDSFKEDMITNMSSSPEGNFDLIGSKYFSNNSNNTSIFENYANLSTIFDASENNNKTSSFANISNCNTFDHLSFDDTGRSGANNCFLANEHVQGGEGPKGGVGHAGGHLAEVALAEVEHSGVELADVKLADVQLADVGSVIRFVDAGASEALSGVGTPAVAVAKEASEPNGVNSERELKPEDGNKNGSVTLTGNTTKGQNKMSKKNKNKKGGGANLANNNGSGSGNGSNAQSGGSNTRVSTFSEVLCTGGIEVKSEPNEKRKNAKKETPIGKNCNNEKDQDDKKNGGSKFLNSQERNDEDFGSVEQACVEKEKGKNAKGKNGEGQGAKKSSNVSSTNKSGSKNAKKGTAESGSNGGTPRNRKQVENDHREGEQNGGKEVEVGLKEVEVGSHGSDHPFRDKASKNGNASEKSRSSAVSGRDLLLKGSSSCGGVNPMSEAKAPSEEVSTVVCSSSSANFDWGNGNQDRENKMQSNEGTTFNSVASVQNRGKLMEIHNGSNSNHGLTRKSTTESTLNNDNLVEDKRQVEESCCQTISYSNCTENGVPLKEQNEYAISNKQLVQHKEGMFYNYARGSLDSKLAGLEAAGGRDGVGAGGQMGEVGGILFGRKGNQSAFALKEGEDHSGMSMQGGSGGMGDELGSIFNLSLNMGNPFSEGRGTPFSEGRGTPFSEGRGTPFSEGRSSPFSEGRSSPFSEGRSSPFSEGRSSPFSEGRSSPFSEGRGNPFSEGRGNPFSENNPSNDTYSHFFIKEESFHPLQNSQFEEASKSKAFNSNEKEANESMDYTNNLLNIFLSCNSINENFECSNEGDNRFADFKDGTNFFSHKEKGVTNGSEFFNSSSNSFNPFGNYNFLGPSCLQCKQYKNEIKNLMVQIKILREELFKCKQMIMASGLNGGNDGKVNPCNYNWTNTKSFLDVYEKKNFVSSIEAND
ncbi:hypothetical protein, conserved [Plasmodium vivax]|uniref:C3H1-type domain-containing protein n=1 Tax=Plasmodium vivax (strain Salvador I) TaxID=126793 RepID=A5K1L8_PLAVS|nr:hypothetical protein, conserved [Plasmodium vivax]EDL46318.1 hypothetical protein, conserved [Plasmodium vivax]|eukprot:XP_001616045.1 hypothetical protein [Plasmodium vivax Sal-1]